MCVCLSERAQFKDAATELRRGEALRTMSPNLHVNCLFKHTVGDTEVCIVVELQVHISAILETKREAHKVRETKCARDFYSFILSA